MKRRPIETRKIDELLPPVASDMPLSERPLPLPVKRNGIARTLSQSAAYSEASDRKAFRVPGNHETALSGERLLERLSVPDTVQRRRRKSMLVAAICAIVLAAAVLVLINIHW